MALEAIIFDLDGVIINSEQLADQANEQFLQSFGFPYERERIKPLLSGRTLLENTKIFMQQYNLTGDVVTLTKKRMKMRAELYEEKLGFIPGFEDFFQEVKKRQLQTAIATTSPPELLEMAKRRLPISEKFGDRIYSVETVGCRSKPAPDIFLYAAQKLAVEPQYCVVIEDAPLGIEAARAAEMRVIALTTTYSSAHLNGATVTVNSFAEIDLKQFY